MKKQKPKRRPFLETFDKKWQRVLIVILIFVCIVCFTFSVLLGVGMLFPEGTAVNAQQPSSSTTTSAAATVDTTVPTVLPKTADACRSYLDSTLFLGDSNTVRFMAMNDVDGETYTSDQNTIAVVGMGIYAIDTLECEEFSSGTYTMTDSVGMIQPQRIIITFGTNNLDGKTTDPSSFIEEYTSQLKKIHEAYEYAAIIVNSIPPIAKDNSYPKLDAKQIKTYNDAIEKMCDTNGWKYLNSYEDLCDPDTGYAVSGYMSSDGIHLSGAGLAALFNYIRTHAYAVDDTRPKPLASIPSIIGPKTTMYNINPLNNETFDENVLNPTPDTTAATPTPSASASAEASSLTAPASSSSTAPAESAAPAATTNTTTETPAPTAETPSPADTPVTEQPAGDTTTTQNQSS